MDIENGIFIAEYCNKVHFGYMCPYCFTKYNKDGKPSKRSKNIVHFHGSCGNTENRTETRSSHCPHVKGEVSIIINENTLKN